VNKLIYQPKNMKNILPFLLINIVLTQGVLFSQSSSAIEVSHEKFKLRENDYVDKIRNLKLSDQKSVSTSFGSINFSLLKEEEHEEDGPEWDYAAILTLNNHYFNLQLGIGHKVIIEDIAGTDNLPEIIINSGCFSDGGCMEKVYIIRILSKELITISDFGEVSMATEENNPYNQNLFLDDLREQKKLGKFIVCGNIYDEITSNCYLTFESYEFSAFGFKKSNFHKKIKIECVG
jgi:hypothetical protein